MAIKRTPVLGYAAVIEQLKKGNPVCSAPYSADWVNIDGYRCSVRSDFFPKAYRAGFKFRYQFRPGTSVSEYYLKEEMEND